MAMRDWVKLPTAWIEAEGLKAFRWDSGQGANNTAALMCLLPLAHYADEDSGVIEMTYDSLETTTGLSRAKISGGLDVLQQHNVIRRKAFGRRSAFKLVDFGASGWGKVPAKRLYSPTTHRIIFMNDFHLRKAVELNAMKLLLLFIARRDNATNLAQISYDKIEDYIGIDREKIRSGLSFLAALGMVHIEHIPSDISKFGISNAYRIPYLMPYVHMGTSARAELERMF